MAVHVQRTSTPFWASLCLHLQIQPEILQKLVDQVEKINDGLVES